MVPEQSELSVGHGQPPSLVSPPDINFNISKAEFKLTILVRPEDMLRPRDDISLSASGLDKEERWPPKYMYRWFTTP